MTAQLYADDDVLLALVTTDEQIANSSEQPTVSVLAWYQKTPLMFMWGNPDWHFESVAEIGRAGVTVLAFGGATYIDVFTGKGLLQPDQIDQTYKGDPARFVAESGNVAQQGFATSEPFKYENEVEEWGRPVDFVLVADEYPVYPNSIVIRADKLVENRACLEQLVPLLQQASVDYAADPTVANDAITRFSAQLESAGWRLSAAAAQEAYDKQIELGLVANGSDGVFGTFDLARVDRLIADLSPALERRGKIPRAGLQAGDLVTNEFLDSTIAI